jgi:hypothetical protein
LDIFLLLLPIEHVKNLVAQLEPVHRKMVARATRSALASNRFRPQLSSRAASVYFP